MNTGNLTIEAKISEELLMESLLNQASLGMDGKMVLFFYALAHSWHIDKLIYYNKLLEGAECSSKTNSEDKR